MEAMKILDSIAERYKYILGKNIVGIYLHGSLAMGCYTNASDIDLIVLVKEPLDLAVKKKIIESVIHMEDVPEKGIEMSIVLEKYSEEFVYPTPFELHYSNFHKNRYLADENYICGGFTDKDLAAHFTIIKRRGICLYGKNIEAAFSEVPEKYYLDSIWNDVENSKEDILENTVYITLNLCRVLYYIKENVVSSKLEAGNWAKDIVPRQYCEIINKAVEVYGNKLKAMECDEELMIKYADYMLEEIKGGSNWTSSGE